MTDNRTAGRLGSSYETVVIGAGLGGLAAAAKLAAHGVRPLVLEQHNVPGGFSTSFVRGRFEFEASLHELSGIGSPDNKGNVRQFLEDEVGVYVDWVPVPEAYRLILPGKGVDVRLPFGVEEYIDAVCNAVPGNRASVEAFVYLCKDVADALRHLAAIGARPNMTTLKKRFRRFLDGSDRPFREMVNGSRKFAALLRTLARSVDEVTASLGVPEEVLDILYPYWCYLGTPTSRLNFTIFGTMMDEYLEYGAYIPRMRSQELSNALADRIRELGGQIEFNTRVEKILVKDNRVEGIVTSAGDEIKTSRLISNASPTLVYNRLIHPTSEVPARARQLVNARRHALSGFVVYLGLDASPKELGLTDYGYFIADHMDTDRIYETLRSAERTPMQASICLNNAIEDCSPPGTTILSLTTLYQEDAWADVTPEDYVQKKNAVADAMIRQFEEGTGVSIRDHIEELEVATPVTFARYTRTHKGVIYGYELDSWDSVFPRILSMREEHYVKGLDFAGGSASMAHGYSSSMLSGREAALMTLHGLRAR